MKFLKMSAIAIMTIANCMGFVSCSDDDKNEPNGGGEDQTAVVNPSNVFTAGIPKDVLGMSITTASNGLITAMATDREKITFTYPSMSRADSYDVIMTIDYDYEWRNQEVFYLSLNNLGFTKYCKEIYSDGDVEEWWFEYNSDGQLIMMKRTEGNEVTDISYENGNITKVKMHSEDNAEGDFAEWIIGYGSSLIENKGCIMLFDQTFGIDMDEMWYAYYAGLLGKATKNLPISNDYTSYYSYEERYKSGEAFTWSMNSNNLPILMTKMVTYGMGSGAHYKYEFIW